MKIHEMHEAYAKRHFEYVDLHNDENIEELRMRIIDVIMSFKEAANKLPEDVIYQAIDSTIDYEDGGCWLYFFMNNDEIEYDFGEEVVGKVQTDEPVKAVRNLTQFISREYWRQIFLCHIDWNLKNFEAELQFESRINETNTQLVRDLKLALPDMTVSVDEQAEDSYLINLNFSM